MAHETTADQSLADGESLTIEITTRYRSGVTLLVDDGAGGAAATYDYDLEAYSDDSGEWHPVNAVTGSTAFSHDDTALPPTMRATVTNQSGASATYRARFVARE